MFYCRPYGPGFCLEAQKETRTKNPYSVRDSNLVSPDCLNLYYNHYTVTSERYTMLRVCVCVCKSLTPLCTRMYKQYTDISGVLSNEWSTIV